MEELPDVVQKDPRCNHDFDKEEMSTGGKSLSPLKVLANSMRHRKWCSVECPFSDSCPMLPLAMAKEEQIIIKGVIKHPCKRRDAPVAVQRRIANLFLNGEEGLLNEIRTSIFVTSTNLGNDNKERMQFTDTLMKFRNSIYGEKGTSINSQEPLEITVRQLSSPHGQAQEVKIGEKGYTNPEMRQLRQEKASALLEKAAVIRSKELPPDIEELDPDSLFNSDKLDDIVGAPDE
jgi:hypothetical protein